MKARRLLVVAIALLLRNRWIQQTHLAGGSGPSITLHWERYRSKSPSEAGSHGLAGLSVL